MRDVVPRTMPFTLLREIIFGDGFFDCDGPRKDALICRCRSGIQFREKGVQLVLFVQLEQGLTHHTVEVGVPPLEFVDREFHPFVL